MKMKLEKINLKKIDLIVASLLMIIALCIYISDSWNVMKYDYISMDESYNSTVAANVIRHGEYKVSYPSDIVFYNVITTGQTVILPTALAFKIFGINSITSGLTSFVYSLGVIVLIWVLLNKCFKNSWGGYTNTLTTVLVILLVLSDSNFQYISTRLIGEIAAIFFVLMALLMLIKYYETHKNYFMGIVGAMIAAAFLTKSSTIFILVSVTGILIIFERNLKLRTLLSYICGFFSCLVILEIYKFIQLGSLTNYLDWWQAEWREMMAQSSGVVTTYSIESKYQYLQNIFSGYTPYFCVIIIVLPILLYFVSLSKNYINSNIHAFSIIGVAGSSLEIFFILLGGAGLVYARRHEINSFIIKVFCFYLLGMLICYLTKRIIEFGKNKEIANKKYNVTGIIGLFIIIIYMLINLLPVKTLDKTIKGYVVYKSNENTLAPKIRAEFLEEIDELPDDAELYCAGWWQEPNITLFLDRRMHNIYDDYNYEGDTDKQYFIVGNFINNVKVADIEELIQGKLTKIDTSEIDYNVYGSAFNREDFELFAIYKITRVSE